MALVLLWATAPVAFADNGELWDLFPSHMEFSQYDMDSLAQKDSSPWFSFKAPAETLGGPPILLTVFDGDLKVRFAPPSAIPFTQVSGANWQWREIFSDNFSVEGCLFTFTVEMGSVQLPAPEGYQLAKRERLFWDGALDVCPDVVYEYFKKATIHPVMPLHLAAWSSIGEPGKPAPSGRFEFILYHDLRRTRHLLPLETTAELDADPFTGQLGSPGNADDRFALIKSRLGTLMFADGFEP